MVEEVSGNLIEQDVEALVNTVNTVGVMGKGIALQFRQAFPDNYKAYKTACEHGDVATGRMLVYHTGRLDNPRIIVNFPTKRHWRGNSELEFVSCGLIDLVDVVRREKITSIAIPPLGCGNGGLEWEAVQPLILNAFAELPDVTVKLFAPAGAPDPRAMRIAAKPPGWTVARAALVLMLERFLMGGYSATKLVPQKLAYFLQEAGEPLKLNYTKHPYGPYAEELNHVLQRIDGHFIRGYGDRTNASDLSPIPSAIAGAKLYLADYKETTTRIDRVSELIEDMESAYGLELLATVHWIAKEDVRAKEDVEAAIEGVHAWSERKRSTFPPTHIRTAWKRLAAQGWL